MKAPTHYFPKGFIKLTLADFIVRSAYQVGKTPLLPIFAAALGASDAFLGIIVSVSTFTGMILKPVIGFLSDRRGRRIWLIAGTVIFTLMPFLYWMVETPQHLFWIRLVHGLATAIYGPVTVAYIAEHTKKRLAENLGWFGLAREGGYIVGPALAGVLLLVWSPQMVFTLIGVLSALAFIPILSLPEPEVQEKKIRKPFNAPEFFRALKQSSAIWFSGGLEFSNYVVLYALKAFLPIYALAAGFNVAVVGSFFAVQEVAHIILKPVTGRLGDRFGYISVISLGMVLLSVSVFGATHAEGIPMFFASAALAGIAQALIFSCNLALVAQRVSKEYLGFSLGLEGSLANAGKVAGPVLAGLLIEKLDYAVSFRVLSVGLTALAVLLFVSSVIQAKRSTDVIASGTD
jgi:MFS family permease